MKKILVPTDFSEYSENALRAAATIAKQQNAEILVLHMMGLSHSGLNKSTHTGAAEAIFHIKLAEKGFKDNQQNTCGKKYIQAQPVNYPGEGHEFKPKEMLAVHHLGKTVRAFHRTADVHNFIKVLLVEETKDYKEALTWQELFIIYEMMGGRNIIGRPISAAKKRAPMAKQIQGFR